jgi:pyridoxine 5-phosphate synthase
MKKVRLGVNIDHIATLRQARKALVPDPVRAAALAERAGASGITVHLRSDRRHIQDRDVTGLKKAVATHLNIEMAATPEMARIAKKVRPDAVCLVPENPKEVTTEGGLDLRRTFSRVKKTAGELKKAGIKVTLFIEPDPEQIGLAAVLGVHAIEINTNAYSEARGKELKKQLQRVARAAELASKLGLEVHAGHGLNCANVRQIARIPQIVELNIGHSIIGRAVFVGLDKAILEILKAM